jgi:hypothetical protein
MDPFHLLHGKEASPDARLIGHDEQFEPNPLQRQQRLRRARKKRDLLRVREILLLLDQRPVPVQKDCASQIQLTPLNPNQARSSNGKSHRYG